MNSKIVDIARKLEEQFLSQSQSLNEISIFLCGSSAVEESKFRRKVGEEISKIVSKYRYSVYLPEDMFIELILGPQKKDLLSLENLLANSTTAVAILLQSPGTFTELGAFANYKGLDNKLIVVIDPKYARSTSFINLGPIRYLKTRTHSKVLFLRMDNGNLHNLVKEIADSARDIAKQSSPIRDLSNPISAYEFYLALIYVFEPISKNNIFKIMKALMPSPDRKEIITTVAETVINTLINERKVSLSSGSLSATSKGTDSLIRANKTRKRAHMLSRFLTELRLQALNLTLRKSYREAWVRQ